MKGLIGKKIGMTQIFQENGDVVSVTVVNAGPCTVIQQKGMDKEGYTAVQLGFEELKLKTKEVKKAGSKVKRQVVPTMPVAGHFKKVGVKPMRYLKEFRYEGDLKLEAAQVLDVSIFNPNDIVDVIGVTKGRGYAGGMRRFGHHGNRASHGVKTHRECGSMGSNTCPGRVYKGHHLPGQYGNVRVTVKNVKVMKVDKENHLLILKGAVPGYNGTVLYVKDPSVKV
ncbi:MAG: 50S ribosomal protein L3 [Candidatus Wallbacteria bacterium]|nr:50S ribosomal protein L3 [Candidatus Wallbacteria bacterium]